jgi:hypothetical protein
MGSGLWTTTERTNCPEIGRVRRADRHPHAGGRSNEVRLWLSVMAYNLGNLWRRLVLPKKIENWSLTSLQQRLVKTGGRLVKHARYYWLLLAESHKTLAKKGGGDGKVCEGYPEQEAVP